MLNNNEKIRMGFVQSGLTDVFAPDRDERKQLNLRLGRRRGSTVRISQLVDQLLNR